MDSRTPWFSVQSFRATHSTSGRSCYERYWSSHRTNVLFEGTKSCYYDFCQLILDCHGCYERECHFMDLGRKTRSSRVGSSQTGPHSLWQGLESSYEERAGNCALHELDGHLSSRRRPLLDWHDHYMPHSGLLR